MNLRDNKVLVIGMGKSGIAAAKLIKRQGGMPFVTEKGKGEALDLRAAELLDAAIDYELGGHDFASWHKFDLIVLSPGINPDKFPILDELNVPVISEVELASYYLKGTVVGITGSNGKSTTTALTGELFHQAGRNVYVVGNIGNPVSDIADSTTDDDVTVIELSSFQLEKIDNFQPDISVLLNLTPDHLDRYPNVEEYYEAKLNLFRGLGISILNADDHETLKYNISGKKLWFSMTGLEPDMEGIFLSRNELVLKLGGSEETICNVSDIAIPGPHNIANAMASALCAITAGEDRATILQGLREFKGLHHRLEYAGTVKGVRFINDSKSTNTDSLQVALKSFTDRVILIAGGYDKHTSFSELEIPDNIAHAVLIGQTREQVADVFGSRSHFADDFRSAIEIGLELAKPGDIVLLSPGCASYDMFDNFEQRGDIFKEIVRGLEKEHGTE